MVTTQALARDMKSRNVAPDMLKKERSMFKRYITQATKTIDSLKGSKADSDKWTIKKHKNSIKFWTKELNAINTVLSGT